MQNALQQAVLKFMAAPATSFPLREKAENEMIGLQSEETLVFTLKKVDMSSNFPPHPILGKMNQNFPHHVASRNGYVNSWNWIFYQ
jgi:hypothetical protein